MRALVLLTAGFFVLLIGIVLVVQMHDYSILCDLNEGPGVCLRAWADPVTAVLTIVAIFFAVTQAREASRQSDAATKQSLDALRSSLATQAQQVYAALNEVTFLIESLGDRYPTLLDFDWYSLTKTNYPAISNLTGEYVLRGGLTHGASAGDLFAKDCHDFMWHFRFRGTTRADSSILATFSDLLNSMRDHGRVYLAEFRSEAKVVDVALDAIHLRTLSAAKKSSRHTLA